MSTHGSVTRVAADLRSDDPSVRNRAAQQIWDRYFCKLLELARSKLHGRIRQREDEEDVLQSMYKSFCLRQQRGDYDLANRDALWKLLVTITLNKTRNVAKEQGRQRRDPAREQSMPGDDEANSARWALEQMEATDPSPQEAAILNEALERRLQALEDPELQQIAAFKLEGWTNPQIAERLAYTERTIERRLDRIRRIWTSFDDGTP